MHALIKIIMRLLDMVNCLLGLIEIERQFH